jgi:bacterial/archaeal transporter family protein
MRRLLSAWQTWALLSAAFAALTAIFAKVGVENVNSDFATFIRTIVILLVLAAILSALGEFESFESISSRTYFFLVLSGLATGASWVCYFRALKLGNASQVAPVDKLSVVLVAIFGVAFLGEKLTGPNWIGVALIAAGAVLIAFRL